MAEKPHTSSDPGAGKTVANAGGIPVPGGVTQHQLAKALFLEDVMAEKLSGEQRLIRWKASSKTYLARARRLIKRLTNMAT